ncbi:ABC transporter ATP-binding protein [Burkholderia sp. WAC0059]|uniref:dipeptide ABC transporter ATP-binding protein n=1 Tax=Burkholderia sp. WAC0059 TaxID=2066022 RepID=UPI000C7EC556|nr:ABC transporter ATP-binding protein [Burkholderia sp. WAC0059]PLZ01801.1 ABC transporter ATP-binding protein [Burkholderia sp. WAC0059]
MALLDIDRLEVDFPGPLGTVAAVRGIDLSLAEGEIVALVGESGSGKSVTASAVAGLLPRGQAAIRGSVRFDGAPLLDLPEAAWRRIRGSGIAMIFQNPLSSLDPSFRIGDQLVETARLRGAANRAEARERAIAALGEVGIEDHERALRAWPHQLSGGMRQRVMIALAVMSQPRLLIADEPTTALDAALQKDILALLKRLNREHGIAILIITHDFGVVAHLSQRVAVMKAGRIVEQGETAQVLAAPRHPYTASLIEAVPEIGLRARDPSPSRRLGARAHRNGSEPARPAATAPRRPDRSVTLLEVRGLGRSFVTRKAWRASRVRTFDAVSQVDFDVRRGEIFGLIGASGSGKSTLARVVAQLVPASAGTVRFDGEDVAQFDATALRRFRRRFQFIFQDSTSSLNPRRLIADQLCDPPLRLGVARDRAQALELARDALERVGLEPGHLNRYPHAFSGGQRQRLGIARALVVQPEFIVLDEPTSALDVSIQAQILNLLLELRQTLDLTYLFIGHSLPVIEFLCDRVAVMEHGRIVETFDATNLQANAAHASTRRLLDAVLPVRHAAPVPASSASSHHERLS